MLLFYVMWQNLHVANALSVGATLTHCAKQHVSWSVEVAREPLGSLRQGFFSCLFVRLLVFVCFPDFAKLLTRWLQNARGGAKNLCEVRLQSLPHILPGTFTHDISAK